jgi:hypothetical protein
MNTDNVSEIVGVCRCKWTYHLLTVKDTRITKLLYRRSPTGKRQSGSTTEKMEKAMPMKKEKNGIGYNLYLMVITIMLS